MFCVNQHEDGELVRRSTNGETYTQKQCDSILPMLNYRQLLADGRMPDSLQGIAVDVKQIQNNSFFFRYRPREKHSPHIELYPLLESMSGRVKLTMPGDVFRIKNTIEFLDPITNEIKKEKSELFSKVFNDKGFKFPAKSIDGNPSTRKPYDEGYFIMDAEDNFFHLKMVNGKCFLRNTKLSEKIKIKYFLPTEPSNREFYGFIFDQDNNLHLLTTKEYSTKLIDTPTIDSENDTFLIMGNMFYWNIGVSSAVGNEIYAVETKSKKKVDQISFKNPEISNKLGEYIFPFSLSLAKSNSNFIKPSIKTGSIGALLINIILTILFFGINKMRKKPRNLYSCLWISLTGIFGFISVMIFNNN